MKKPVVLVVMDGVGESSEELGNMVMKATTPTLDALKANDPFRIIKAHGTAVGLPSDDDMGNSEVGHNAPSAPGSPRNSIISHRGRYFFISVGRVMTPQKLHR